MQETSALCANVGHTAKILANIERYDVIEIPSRLGVFGTHETLAWENGKRSNFSIHTLVGTAIGQVNDDVIRALTEAEAAVWATRQAFSASS